VDIRSAPFSQLLNGGKHSTKVWFELLRELEVEVRDKDAAVIFPENLELPSDQYSTFLTEDLLSDLKEGASCGVRETLSKHTVFKGGPGVLRLVAHLRRGDVTKAVPMRWAEDDYYFNVVAGIRAAVGSRVVDAHAFTSCTTAKDCASSNTNNLVKKYAGQLISLHVSREYATQKATEDAISTWAHFIEADIFLMAKSSFSHVPAMLNRGCVVYQAFWHAKLPHWISIDQGSLDSAVSGSEKLQNQNRINELAEFFREELPRCLLNFQRYANKTTAVFMAKSNNTGGISLPKGGIQPKQEPL
jgi:hypothetical protein